MTHFYRDNLERWLLGGRVDIWTGVLVLPSHTAAFRHSAWSGSDKIPEVPSGQRNKANNPLSLFSGLSVILSFSSLKSQFTKVSFSSVYLV